MFFNAHFDDHALSPPLSQARIMIGTWRIARALPGGSHMVAITRVLHRTTPDELMEEVKVLSPLSFCLYIEPRV